MSQPKAYFYYFFYFAQQAKRGVVGSMLWTFILKKYPAQQAGYFVFIIHPS